MTKEDWIKIKDETLSMDVLWDYFKEVKNMDDSRKDDFERFFGIVSTQGNVVVPGTEEGMKQVSMESMQRLTKAYYNNKFGIAVFI